MVLISLLVEERNEFCGHMEILRCGGQKPGQTDKFRTVRTFQVRAFARTKDVPVFFFYLPQKYTPLTNELSYITGAAGLFTVITLL